MATPGTYNLTLQRRADHSFDVNLKDSNNANENLTGKTIQKSVRFFCHLTGHNP
jgi:hypothetical protein